MSDEALHSDEGAFEVEGEADRINLEPGIYAATFETWETRHRKGFHPKVVCWWRIDDGLSVDPPLVARFYNATALIGPARRRGRFRVGANSAFLRDFARLTTYTRADRLAASRLVGVKARVLVAPATVDHKGQAIPEGMAYSRIERIEPIHE